MSVSEAWDNSRWQYRIRRMLPDDLPAVIAMWTRQHPFPPALEAELDGLLSSLVAGQYLVGAVVDCLRGPGRQWEVAAFGLGCFMAEALRERYLRKPFSLLAVHVLEHAHAGHIADVLLSRQQVNRLQQQPPARLDYCVLAWLQERYDLADAHARNLLLLGLRVMERYMTGFRLRSLLLEGSLENMPAFQMAGFTDLRDCSALVPRHHAALKDDPRYRPYLHGLHTQELALRSSPMSMLSRLFMFSEPVMGLTDSQKEVLDLAVDGHSDRAIAQLLGISANAVHMRWRGIYDKAGDILPELAIIDGDGEAGCRGQEKRRIVVEYIREHPQEIRPWIHMPRRPRAAAGVQATAGG